MIDVAIPGFGHLALTDLVCDFNGTLACDGRLIEEVRTLLPRIAALLEVCVVTGDTFGSARSELDGLPCEVIVLPSQEQARAKAELVARLGAGRVVAIGNGRNDRWMLTAAALGVGVVGDEGIAGEAAQASDLIVRHAADAFRLLLEPRRLVAGLRD
jgi:soluble P-type ATPase